MAINASVRHFTCATLVLFASIPAALNAQGRTEAGSPASSNSISDSVRGVNDRCDTIAAVISRDGFGAMVARSSDSVKMLAQCPNTAIAVVSNAWKTVKVDSAELTTLMWLSASVRDRRIEDVVKSTITDTSRSPLIRKSAIMVIRSYFDNTVGIMQRMKPDSTDNANTPPRWYIRSGSFSIFDVHQVNGDQPVGPEYRRRMHRFLFDLGIAAQPSNGVYKTNDDREMSTSIIEAYRQLDAK